MLHSFLKLGYSLAVVTSEPRLQRPHRLNISYSVQVLHYERREDRYHIHLVCTMVAEGMGLKLQ